MTGGAPRTMFVLAERAESTHRHILMRDGADRSRVLCRWTAPEHVWTFVQPDPASDVPMCLACLKAADRVAELADAQEGISDAEA